jgi:cytoskeletal protein CcmA (bactofilin family)
MFRKRTQETARPIQPIQSERVTSVLGSGTIWKGSLSGSGGVRIEGAFDGDIALRGLLVVGATGRVTCPHLRASVVIIAGALRGDITAEKVEIRASGRVWGDVVTAAFSTEEGAFLRGQIRMEDKVDIGVAAVTPAEAVFVEESPPAQPGEAAQEKVEKAAKAENESEQLPGNR